MCPRAVLPPIPGVWGPPPDGPSPPAPSPRHRVLLTFTFMDTECTYDYLFVYDGDSPRSPLLASLSGSTLPAPLEATSGKVPPLGGGVEWLWGVQGEAAERLWGAGKGYAVVVGCRGRLWGSCGA